ncbi:hypothetical protein N0V83_003894 [Neocucurbitaria cava]|uniref:Uncharacterized protein n=1 Tax=Neocucurbitaria cava TaxID=798079 RepID=A0A9W8YCN9_9PLEO|nr:hypothetical protein N0V83_003894 [Neocucurbitaria cava]
MVYITSDLFGPTTTHDREHNPNPTFWQNMATAQYSAGLGKRKRHEEEERPSQYETSLRATQELRPNHSSNNHQGHHRLPPSEWVSHPQSFDPPPLGRDNTLAFALYSATMNAAASERRPVKQLKRHGPKAVLVKSTSHLMDIEPDLPPTVQLAVTDLRPCHTAIDATAEPAISVHESVLGDAGNQFARNA